METHRLNAGDLPRVEYSAKALARGWINVSFHY